MIEATADTSRQRSLSPSMLITGILVAAGVVVCVVLMVLPEPGRRPYPRGIVEATLADGTVLVLHTLTHGSDPSIALPSRDKSWWVRLGLASPKMLTFRSGNAGESLGLWFSRHDPRTGEVLPFDRWSHCIAETASGERVMDEPYAQRHSPVPSAARHPRRFSMSHDRPFDPIGPGHFEHIVYHSRLPVLRPDGNTFQLEVYDADDGLIATLDVPFPAAVGSFPAWSPDSLPVTQSDGDLEVTLTKLTAGIVDEPHPQPHSLQRIHVTPEFSIRQQGEVTHLWSEQRLTLTDALGNSANPHPYSCWLSLHEAAWQLNLRLFRDEQAPFDSAQRLTVEDVSIPLLGKSVHPGGTLTYDGVTVELLGVGGLDTVEHPFSSKLSGESQSYGSEDSHGRYDVRVEYHGPHSRATVTAERVHVLLKVTGATSLHKVDVVMTDQNGLRQDLKWKAAMGVIRLALVDVDEWVTHVNVNVLVQRGRYVEFRVAPPPFPHIIK